MSEEITYRPMRPGEEAEVCDLVARVFGEFVAPGYSDEGRQEFVRYAQPAALRDRSRAGHFTLVADALGEIVGMIEVRGDDHVSLLFVDPRVHRQGIARELLRQALDSCLRHNPALAEVSVNSSPYAVPAYERMGFRCVGPAEVRNGIEFVPMLLQPPALP